MRILLPTIALAACALAAAADEWYAPYIAPQQLVRISDGRALNLYCVGAGSPTVMLEAGLTGPMLTWRKVHAAIASTAATRVCAYDRAGMGFSDPGPAPRTVLAEVEDLEDLLRHAEVRPPYVLVGGSMGAAIVRLFTDRNRNDVVGMVLVDPAVDNQAELVGTLADKVHELDAELLAQMRRCDADARAGKLLPGSDAQESCDYWGSPDWPKPLADWWQAEVASADYQSTVLSEAESSEASNLQVTSSRRHWGALPLIVLTAEEDLTPVFGKDAPAVTRAWVQAHDEIASLSTLGSRRTVAGADHNIQSSRPQAVIDAVVETVASSRARARP